MTESKSEVQSPESKVQSLRTDRRTNESTRFDYSGCCPWDVRRVPCAGAGETTGNGKLAFFASGTNEFTFDTGVLKGKLRAGGKSTGLSSVVHLPTGLTLDSSMGLFGHYRVFSANKRYGTAAWDWPSEARLRPDGSVEVRWPSAEDRPFELRAVYRWAAPDTLDLETSVQAKTNLAKFESFLASYFSEGFTNACVYVRSNSQAWLDGGGQE